MIIDDVPSTVGKVLSLNLQPQSPATRVLLRAFLVALHQH
jgi:hypothetical protein